MKKNRSGKTSNYRRHTAGGAFGSFITTLLLVVAIGVFAYSGYRLIGYYLDYKKGTDEYSSLNDDYVSILSDDDAAASSTGSTEGALAAASGLSVLSDVSALESADNLQTLVDSAVHEEVEENGETKSLPVMRNPVDFDDLQSVNEDIVAWIRVGAIDVSYPVAQSDDNDYYLHRTFKGEDNFAGCIFLNCDNSKYFTDQNTVIYGHNMKNGSMFGRIKKFVEQETYEKNKYIWIFTPDFIYQYEIFGCSVVGSTGDPYLIRFSKSEFKEFLEKMVAASDIKTTATVTENDRIITLSTCTGDSSTRRVLQGVLVQTYVAE